VGMLDAGCWQSRFRAGSQGLALVLGCLDTRSYSTVPPTSLETGGRYERVRFGDPETAWGTNCWFFGAAVGR
jgi:hypothetical protein